MRRLRWYDYISINLFWLGLNIRNTAIGSVFMPYLVAGFVSDAVKNTALSGMRTAGLVIAMLVQPAMGLLSDRCTSRFGRRRPFIFIGGLLDLVFLAAIGLSGSYSMLLIAILLQQFAANISHGPLQALIPDLVPEDQRGRASAVKAIMELLPLVLIGFTISQLVNNGKVGLALVATGAGILITMLLTMILVREQPLRAKPDVPLGPPMLRVLGMLAGILVGAAAGLAGGGVAGGLAGLIAWPIAGQRTALAVGAAVGALVAMPVAVGVGVWAGTRATLGEDARRRPSFAWWIINRLLFLAAATSIQGVAPYFLQHLFNTTREAAQGLNGNLMIGVGGFILLSAIPGGWLADRFGHRRLLVFSGLVAAASAGLLIGTMWLPSIGLVYVAGCVLGLATGLFMTANWALGTELVPAAEAGRYLGISNLAGAGAGMIGAGIGGPVADYLNAYRPGLGYFAIFACYGVLFILSAFSLRGVRQSENYG